jgi:hypothetical protein
VNYDLLVLIIGGVLVLAVTGIYLFLSVLLWNVITGLRAILLLLVLALGAGVVWAFLGVPVGMFLSFCSFCFQPGTPSRNAFYATLGLPYRDSVLPFGILNFPIIVNLLYLLGFVPAIIKKLRK